MKLKPGFITHTTDAGQIMVSADDSFRGIVRSNRTAALIVDCLKTETTENAIVERLRERYDVSLETAEADVRRILSELRGIGAIDDEDNL